MRLRRPRPEAPPPHDTSVLDHYVRSAPAAQNAIDVFAGEWASRLPGHVGVVAGTVPLFEDPRLTWIIERAGGVDGRSVLELGPLEGGHTWMLESAGAHVTAIESNSRAYLRCLVVKELLPLRRASFLLGDFLPYLESSTTRFELLVASGVLYHAPDPARLLHAMSTASDRLGIWTHYFHPELARDGDWARRRFESEPVVDEVAGVALTLHRRLYLESLQERGFCGGPEESAMWVELDQLVSALHALGYSRVEIGNDDHDHPHGPCALLYAERS